MKAVQGRDEPCGPEQTAERGNPFSPGHKTELSALRIKARPWSLARSGRDHVMTNGHLLPLSLFPSFLSAPSPFLLSLRTAGNEAISRARFRLCENFRSHFLIISPSSSTPLPHLAEKMAPDGPWPLSLLVPLFQVSTLPSTPANLVLKFRRESNLPAFSSPLSLGESRHPLSPYPPLISSVLARSLVVIRAY